ncbi:MAG: hypothetical protein HKN49_05210, partial [Gammaproteobacteria bacterium]|nr:hypothetical protein [Gammaproteobacteria bacterium]
LDGDFYDSMRLRSTDTRNIINTWAAAVVIAFTFVSDLAWRDARRRQRQAIVIMLALLAAVIVLLSASRAALALYLAALLFVSARETLHGGISGRLGVIVLWIALAIVTMTLLQDSAMMMRLTVLAGGDDGSAMQRLSAYVAVDSTLQQAFWLGHGQSLAEQAGSASENTFLAVVHRYGLIGLLIYSGFWLWLCRIGIQHFRELQFTASIAVTFLSLFTNDLLFFPLAIFVFAEVLRIDKQSGTDRVGVRPTVRRAWPA